MYRLKGYGVSEGILREWGERLIPEEEWFYFIREVHSISMEPLNTLDYSEVGLDIRTSYLTWGISTEVRYYTRMNYARFESLPKKTQEEIVAQQWESRRGLLFKKEVLCELFQVPSIHAHVTTLPTGEDIIHLHRGLWETVSEKSQFTFLLNYGAMWVEEDSIWNELSMREQKHLISHAPHLEEKIDTFPTTNGPNCLAAVAMAISNIHSFMDQWMHGEEFLAILQDQEYVTIDTTDLRPGDVLVWFDNSNQPIHAAYAMTESYAFNKHGQTMFNPWQVLKIEDVLSSWSNLDNRLAIFRR